MPVWFPAAHDFVSDNEKAYFHPLRRNAARRARQK
jgi:hypothetical protein